MGNLSDKLVREIGEPGRYTDGRDAYGLSLLVKEGKRGIRKTWTQRLKVDGKYKNMGLGAYPVVSLMDARGKALDNARAVSEYRQSEPEPALTAPVPNFDASTLIAILEAQGFSIAKPVNQTPLVSDALEQVIELKRAGWKDEGKTAYRTTEHQWRQSLAMHAPSLMGMQVGEIDGKAIMDVLSPIWQSKRETATRVRDRMNEIMKWAIANGYRSDNPVESVKAALPKNKKKVTHMKALPHADVRGALATIRERKTLRGHTALAIQFCVLTATRLSETRFARRSEITTDAYGNHVWILPAERMKNGKEHRIPLSEQAFDIVAQAIDKTAMKHGEVAPDMLIFPASGGGAPHKAQTVNGMTKALRRCGVKSTMHGFRSSFRDWAAEMTDAPREITEACLAHTIGTQVELAYRRTDYYDKRRELMQAWADYIAGRIE